MVRPPSVVRAMTEPTGAAAAAPAPKKGTAKAVEQRALSDGEQRRAVKSPSSDRAPVIRSKIQPPPLRSSTLSRQRLLDRLSDAVSSRLTLVVAEAGYGKTTLLADFSARAPFRCLWYRLDPTDADPVTWTNYLIAAVREVDPDFGERTLSLLSQVAPGGPPETAFVASLIGELARLGEAPTVLVLDDFHSVDESPGARAFVSRLLQEAPPWLHVVIASRRRPDLELARLAGMGELVEIRTEDLTFSRVETERLFADAYGVPLEPDVLRFVDSRTRGWAASLQLFHGSIRGRPSSAVRALAKSMSGAASPIYDFLAQEVLNNLPNDLEEFLIRAALLDQVVPSHVIAMFGEGTDVPTVGTTRSWIDDADRLGLLTRSSESSESRQLHPLLRDFLVRTLNQRHSTSNIRKMHLGVAQALTESDPLSACGHFLEAGEQIQAMHCLGRSVMLTMGSGQWGTASDLIDRLDGVRADAAVAAIQARRLIEEGDLVGAGLLLGGITLSDAPADVRAVFRYSKLSLGWRTGDREFLFATLDEIRSDAGTPSVLRDIAQVFVDASPLSLVSVSYPSLVRRLEGMARTQLDSGHGYYAAISLHNAAIVELVVGHPGEAIQIGERALQAFDNLSFPASERFSTHAVLATCWLEMGHSDRAEEHIELGLSTGGEHADVHAQYAYLCALTGDRERAERMLLSADALLRQGLSDLQAVATTALARAFLSLASDPRGALDLMARQPRERPLDMGDTFAYDILVALGHVLSAHLSVASEMARNGLEKARLQSARSAEVRFALIWAIADDNSESLRIAVADAKSVGELPLLEAADAIGQSLHLLTVIPSELNESIRRWPSRWLPVLRRQLARGNVPAARVAALLLEEHGQAEDIVRLRAYAKTYSRIGRVSNQLGRVLAKRVGDKLEVLDLGRVRLRIGTRGVDLSAARRKPASLLMYLITRPSLTATREQVLDELWPDNDPGSAANSLNQSLYFLRRDIDPWYEDDMSVEYVPFEGDLIWLDPDLVKVTSVEFVGTIRRTNPTAVDPAGALQILDQYGGQFAPEFEYEEWAIAWRSRVHAACLEFASNVVATLMREGDIAGARDVAVRTFELDPEARDIERTLIGLYWTLGARSAASAQYQHLASQERADGMDPPALETLIAEGSRTHGHG